jgi:hypothetical protein
VPGQCNTSVARTCIADIAERLSIGHGTFRGFLRSDLDSEWIYGEEPITELGRLERAFAAAT